MEQAKQQDEWIKQNKNGLNTLTGIPISIKDNLTTQGTRTTAGSKFLQKYEPPFDATVVKRLKDMGAIIVGKTNMDEFGMGSSTENSAFKVTHNPWDPQLVPGGSSGGAAAAQAAQFCTASLGTDTGGSIRQPASFCGQVGLKPTYGRVSRYGLVAFASSLDCVGPITTTVEDSAILLNVLAGYDSEDSSSSKRPIEDYTSAIQKVEDFDQKPLKGLRVGVVDETLSQNIDPAVEQTIKHSCLELEKLGAQVEKVSIPKFCSGLPAYYIIALSEASSNLSRYDNIRYGQIIAKDSYQETISAMRQEGFGCEVKRRIIMGTYSLSAGYCDAYYKRALQVRYELRQDVACLMTEYDILLTPTFPHKPFKIGEKSSNPLDMYQEDIMTVVFSLTGHPSISVPALAPPLKGKLKTPLSIQLVGRLYEESLLLKVAHIFEKTQNIDQFPDLEAVFKT